MYEQSYCSLFYDTCSFCFFDVYPPEETLLCRLRHRVASIQFRGCCCAIGLSCFDRLLYRNRVFVKLSV